VVPAAPDPYVFVAGTAAIRGHATIAPGDLDAQIDCTLENLQGIGEACGVGAALGAGGNWQRIFKIYLRHREDLPRVIARVENALLAPGDQVVYLRADICRGDLVVEIEARLVPR
jgi:enamine deaminase RidA (YjgF/YER057c/UK114 family)